MPPPASIVSTTVVFSPRATPSHRGPQHVRLIDYELLKDPQSGARLVRFGAFAGYAGASSSATVSQMDVRS